jgi:hypothetical protein
VEGSRNDGGGAGGGGQNGYSQLPADAKAQCDRQASRFIGKADAQGNVKYKTIDDYRAYYANTLFDNSVGVKHLNA